MAFSDAISRYIPGFTNGKIGACIYRNLRNINRTTNTPTLPSHEPLLKAFESGDHSQIEAELHRMQQSLSGSIDRELADEPYFLKELSFSEESEVRIVWSTPYDVKEPLHITCPEAIQFCTPGIPLSKEFKKNPQGAGDRRGVVLTGRSEP